MTSTPSPDAAREAARRRDGKFGAQERAEGVVDLGLEQPEASGAAADASETLKRVIAFEQRTHALAAHFGDVARLLRRPDLDMRSARAVREMEAKISDLLRFEQRDRATCPLRVASDHGLDMTGRPRPNTETASGASVSEQAAAKSRRLRSAASSVEDARRFAAGGTPRRPSREEMQVRESFDKASIQLRDLLVRRADVAGRTAADLRAPRAARTQP